LFVPLPAPLAIDGAIVAFQRVTPAAKPLIQAAMRQLSAESSRRRFFTVRRQLSDAELARFTELDGWQHEAIGAVAYRPGHHTEGVGIARFARLADRPRVAEAAVVVVDAWQRRGVGRRLLQAIARVAIARGIDRLRGIVLRDNDPMLALLARYAPRPARIDAGDHVDVEVALDAGRLAGD